MDKPQIEIGSQTNKEDGLFDESPRGINKTQYRDSTL